MKLVSHGSHPYTPPCSEGQGTSDHYNQHKRLCPAIFLLPLPWEHHKPVNNLLTHQHWVKGKVGKRGKVASMRNQFEESELQELCKYLLPWKNAFFHCGNKCGSIWKGCLHINISSPRDIWILWSALWKQIKISGKVCRLLQLHADTTPNCSKTYLQIVHVSGTLRTKYIWNQILFK